MPKQQLMNEKLLRDELVKRQRSLDNGFHLHPAREADEKNVIQAIFIYMNSTSENKLDDLLKVASENPLYLRSSTNNLMQQAIELRGQTSEYESKKGNFAELNMGPVELPLLEKVLDKRATLQAEYLQQYAQEKSDHGASKAFAGEREAYDVYDEQGLKEDLASTRSSDFSPSDSLQAKKQKVAVLEAAADCLQGKKTPAELKAFIAKDENKNYADATFRSETKKLVDEVIRLREMDQRKEQSQEKSLKDKIKEGMESVASRFRRGG